MSQPLAIDLFCGLGGWTDGLLAEGYRVVGFDNERHDYDGERYPAQLVLQDVLTLQGSQFRDAALIVASPPCQEYSYMAMPWSRAKEVARQYESGERDRSDLTRLFDACFRIQREACEAAQRHVPMVVENVRGAQRWVGRARWNFGSFYLWGDVPALMPIPVRASKVPGFRFDGNGGSFQSAAVAGTKVPTMGAGWYPPGHPKHVPGLAFNTHADRHTKNTGGSWFNIGSPGQKVVNQNPVHGCRTAPGNGARFTTRDCGPEGVKQGGEWFHDSTPGTLRSFTGSAGRKQPGIGGPRDNGKGDAWFQNGAARHGSRTSARKAASARIAKIPLLLARHIAESWYPREVRP